MNLLCLSEIGDEILSHSYLFFNGKTKEFVYCVLSKTHLILFRKPNEVISFKCVLITKKLKVEHVYNTKEFSLNFGEFCFTFTSEDCSLIKNWVTQINHLIENYIAKPPIDFSNAEVKIDEIKSINGKCYIMIEDGSHYLYIYENLIEHKWDISIHIINLKFYTIKNKNPEKSRRSSKPKNNIKLIGNSNTFTFTFENSELMIKWNKIFNTAIIRAFNENRNPILQEIYTTESNKYCADCHYPNPEWVSINLCVIVCLKCSGYHRSLNVSCSRIQSAIMDKRVWEDSYLIGIMKKIGNEKVNSFWFKNHPITPHIDDKIFIEDKYQNKKFIDKEYSNLSIDDFTNRLKLSVATDDVFLTMRLWHSINFHYEFDLMENLKNNLIEIAKNSNQPLQEKFISLQLNSGNKIIHKINEKILKISYNHSEKLDDLFIVCLTNDCITIKIENSSLTSIEYIDVCYINLSNINLVKCNKDNNILISINPECIFNKFLNKKSIYNSRQIAVNRITFFNQSDLNEFTLDLLKALIPNDLCVEIDDSKLFLNLDVENQDVLTKCKCLVTSSNISFDCPISTKYDLKKSTNLIKLKDKTIKIEFNKDQFQLITTNSENQNLIYDQLKLCVPLKKILIGPIDKMLSFIRFHGLDVEGVFRISGTNRKIETLLNLIEKSDNDFDIDSTNYCVHDVASCLKKYLRSFHEPLIPNDLFELFKQASICDNFNKKINNLEYAVSSLPDINYDVLRKFIELLYMIQIKSENNKMDSNNLAGVTALTLISFDTEKAEDAILIMKELIDNIFEVFHYTPKDKENINKFLLPMSSVQNTIRDFYVHSCLKKVLIKNNSDVENFDFLDGDNRFFVIKLNVDKITIKAIYEKLFNKEIVELWHFLTKRKAFHTKTIKRLIYLNDNCENSVVNPKIFSGYKSYFIFFKKQKNPIIRHEKSFQCEFKFKCEKYQDSNLVMQYPNLLEIFINQNTNEPTIHKLRLSDLQLYRFHSRNNNRVFLLFGESGFYRLKFDSIDILQEFLYFFDKFRMKHS